MKTSSQAIQLTDSERKELQTILRREKHSARLQTYARLLLKAEEGLSDNQTARLVQTSPGTVWRIKKMYRERGLSETLREKRGRGKKAWKLDGRGEAQLTQLVCSAPPKGRARWTVRLLADRMVELSLVDSISHGTVHNVLKKMSLRLTKRSNG